jgi:hypothetical protein
MQRQFRQIVDVKFKRRCRFYFEFWRFRIEDNHHCCVKYENSRHFFVDSSRVRKISREFSNSLFLNDVNNIYSRINIFRCQHVQWSIFNLEKFFRKLRWIRTKRIFFWRRNVIFFVQWLIFSRKFNHFFVWSFFSRKKLRYLDCNKNVNWRWFRWWCIIKRWQLKFDWWWSFFLYHRFRSNILSKII